MKVFLDMDGVLCDFCSAAFAVNGAEYDPNDYPKGTWNLEEVLGVTKEELWHNIDSCGVGFWMTLRPYAWTKAFVHGLLELTDDIVISTSPSRSPNCYAGKRIWLDQCRTWCPELSKMPVMMGSHKYLLANPNRILIDDGLHNIDKWRICGGKAIVFQQPWNTDSEQIENPAVKALTDLKTILGKN